MVFTMNTTYLIFAILFFILKMPIFGFVFIILALTSSNSRRRG